MLIQQQTAHLMKRRPSATNKAGQPGAAAGAAAGGGAAHPADFSQDPLYKQMVATQQQQVEARNQRQLRKKSSQKQLGESADGGAAPAAAEGSVRHTHDQTSAHSSTDWGAMTAVGGMLVAGA